MSRMVLVAGLGVLVEDGQPHGDLERRGVGHAALFALGHVILQLQADRVAALVAEVGRVGVVGAALAAQHLARMKRIGNHGGAAVAAGGAQVMQPLQVAALALPVADGKVHELQLRDIAEIGDREHRLEHRLQAGIVALAGQPIHLQEAVIGALLHLDQVRDLDRRRNLGEIKTLAKIVVLCHSETPDTLQAQPGLRANRTVVGVRAREKISCRQPENRRKHVYARRGHGSPQAPLAASSLC